MTQAQNLKLLRVSNNDFTSYHISTISENVYRCKVQANGNNNNNNNNTTSKHTHAHG